MNIGNPSGWNRHEDASKDPSPRFLVTGICLLASFFVFYHLGQKNYCLDEGISTAIAKMPWRDFRGLLTTSELNMWLYFVLLKVWAGIGFGNTEAFARSLSALFAVAAVPALYGLVKRLFGGRTGTIAVLLISVNAFFVTYAQEARGYALVLFLVIASSYLFVRMTENRGGKSLLFGYVIVSALAVYTHLFASLVLLAHALSVPFLPKERFGALLRPLTFAYLSIAVLLSPLIYFILINGGRQEIYWISKPTFSSIKGLVMALSGDAAHGKYQTALYLFPCGIAFIHAVSCIAGNRRSLETWRFVFVFLWMTLPVVLSFGVSYIKPVFDERYLIVSFPALVVTVGLGLSLLEDKRARALLLALLVFLSVRSLFTDYYPGGKWDNSRETASYVMSEARRGDGILFYRHHGIICFEYYLRKINPPLDVLDSVYPATFGHYRYPVHPDLSVPFLEGLKDRYERVWIVLLPGNIERGFLLSTLGVHYRVEREKTFPGIGLLLLVKR